MDTFFAWLGQQTERRDSVGALARHAVRDKIFPRHAWRLHIFLLRYQHIPDLREACKQAHAEWRRARRNGAAA